MEGEKRFGFFTPTENIRGILLMVMARLVFAGSDTCTKLASSRLPATEVIVMRNLISLPVIFALAWHLGGLRYRAAFRDRIVIGRSVLEGTGTIAFVAALPFITLGQSAVILLTVPIILVALSAIIYKEDVGWRRWSAIVIGFFGVVLVANPFGGSINPYLLLAQFTAVTWAFRDLVTARIGTRIPSVTVALINTVVVGLIALPGVLWEHWRGFDERELSYLVGAGILVTISNYLYIAALRTGAISVVAPFRYSAAVWASIAGFIVWGDIPDLFGVSGAILIVGSGLYTFYRELDIKRMGRAPGSLARAGQPR